MLKRTTITHVNNILEKNINWKILDIGCGYKAHKKASVIADIQDFSDFYKERKFILIREKNLPFIDKEFDFVIALIEPFITVSVAKFFEKIFTESLVIQLAWEDKIEYKIDNKIRQENVKITSFFKIIRKYLSKKMRTIFK